MVLGESYGDEMEIKYFEKKEKWWVLKDSDMDSIEPENLKLVNNFKVDGRSHYFFLEAS